MEREDAVDHPKSWLRYIDAGKVADRTLNLDGMKVRNSAGDKLGDVDGLIVDSDSGRTYYIVVDAPGWFTSKQFLLPIGQTKLDNDRDALVVNLTTDQVKRFPGFDKDEFDKLSEGDIKRINDDIGMVFEPNMSYPADEPYYKAWNRRAYQYPDWWTMEPSLPGGRDADASIEVESAALSSRPAVPPKRQRSPQTEERSEARDTSPHFAGRAQPGDVLGVETEGETTSVGDTKEDERQRLEKAKRADRKKRR
jgi:PRC-barrel domain protein